MFEAGDLISALAGSLIGGVFAILGTLWGAKLQHDAQLKLMKRADEAEIAGYLGALQAELTAIWGSFQARVEPPLSALPNGEVFAFQWPARHDYFSVYNANATLLGRVPDPELRTLIVATYTAAKGMLDSLGYNGEAVDSLTHLKAGPDASQTARARQIAELNASLTGYAAGLKASAVELAGMVQALLPRLALLSDRLDGVEGRRV